MTAYEMRISDWSSDVCSSDLKGFLVEGVVFINNGLGSGPFPLCLYGNGRSMLIAPADIYHVFSSHSEITHKDICRQISAGNMPNMKRTVGIGQCRGHCKTLERTRPEERRVGKEWVSTCRSRGAPYT